MPDPIDWPQLKKRCLNDDAFVREMVAIFSKHAPILVAGLKTAVAAGDTPAAKKQAHTLKGSAANLAAESLRASAYAAEMLAKDGKLDETRDAIPVIEKELNAVLEALERFLKAA